MGFESIKTEIFADRLKNVRDERGFTQKELGSKVGLTKATISKYENKINPPKLHHAHCLAKALNVSFNWLIGYSDDRYEVEGHIIVSVYNRLSDKSKQELYDFANYLLIKEQEGIIKLEG